MAHGPKASPREPTWRSILADRPNYVQAIGMISIENANLEMSLADLLAAVLHIRAEVGHAILFAARSANLRLDILEAAASTRLRPKREGDRFYENEGRKANSLRNVLGIIRRARSAIGRRHAVIHDAWGIEDTTGEVFRAPLPDTGKSTLESMATLNNLIRDIRNTISDARALARSMRGKPPMLVDMRLEQPGKSQ